MSYGIKNRTFTLYQNERPNSGLQGVCVELWPVGDHLLLVAMVA